MSDATGLAEAMLGLEGFTVLAVREDPSELVISVESTAVVVGCGVCGVRAQAQDRVTIDVRDLACFGRPTRLVWRKRRWRCREERCAVKTWTEESPAALARHGSRGVRGSRRAVRSASWPGRCRRWRRRWGCVGGRS